MKLCIAKSDPYGPIDFPVHYTGIASSGAENRLTDSTKVFSSDMIGKHLTIFTPAVLMEETKFGASDRPIEFHHRPIVELVDEHTLAIQAEPTLNVVKGTRYMITSSPTIDYQHVYFLFMTDSAYEDAKKSNDNFLTFVADIEDELLNNSPLLMSVILIYNIPPPSLAKE
jgi:hypothetical protein